MNQLSSLQELAGCTAAESQKVKEVFAETTYYIWNDLRPTGLQPKIAVEHLCGANKLLGEWYGLACVQLLDFYSEQQLEGLTRISIMTRSAVVIQDQLDDEYLTSTERCFYLQWLDRVARVAKSWLSNWTNEVESLWRDSFVRAAEGTLYLTKYRPCTAVAFKNDGALLPLRLPVFKGSRRALCFEQFIIDYLFALQLVDDFEDLVDDFSSGKNANLFLAGGADGEEVLALRSRFLPLLARFIAENICQYTKSELGTGITRNFQISGIEWLHSWARHCSASSIDSFRDVGWDFSHIVSSSTKSKRIPPARDIDLFTIVGFHRARINNHRKFTKDFK